MNYWFIEVLTHLKSMVEFSTRGGYKPNEKCQRTHIALHVPWFNFVAPEEKEKKTDPEF